MRFITFWLFLAAAIGTTRPALGQDDFEDSEFDTTSNSTCIAALTPEPLSDHMDRLQSRTKSDFRIRHFLLDRNALPKRQLPQWHNPFYTQKIYSGPILNQGDNEDCWAFASVAFLHSLMAKHHGYEGSFQLSTAYYVYWATMELAHLYLSDYANNEIRVSQGFEEDSSVINLNRLSPGGSAVNAFELFKKYGAVPEYAMPSSQRVATTARMFRHIQEFLARHVSRFEQILNSDSSPDKKTAWIRRTQARLLDGVSTIAKSYLGDVPTKFRMATPDNYGMAEFDPHKLMNYILDGKVDLNDFRHISFDPEKAATRMSVDSPTRVYYFLSPDRLPDLLKGSIGMGLPVIGEISASRDLDPNIGIMHPSMNELNGVVGRQPALPSVLLKTGLVPINHAVLITGYDQPTQKKNPRKYLVHNSDGESWGDNGFFHLYASSLNYLATIVVHKDLLTAEESRQMEASEALARLLLGANLDADLDQ